MVAPMVVPIAKAPVNGQAGDGTGSGANGQNDGGDDGGW